jgi:energy-coupling factor transporter ATP-binding protein EcfA2
MIESITFQFGTGAGRPKLTMPAAAVTVFVGPNNGGKSQALVEIERYCRNPQNQIAQLVIDSINFSSISQQRMEAELARIEVAPLPGETVYSDHIVVSKPNPQGGHAPRLQFVKQRLIAEAQNPGRGTYGFGQFLGIYTLRLDGQSRLALVGDQPAGDLQSTASNHLAHLFVNNELRAQVRRIVYEAFDKYFVIDPTNVGQLRIRLSEREPSDEREEKGWEQRSIDFHRRAVEVRFASDGVKAFVGIITTLLAGDPRIILIDEPEAFLHPALSHALGKEISRSLGSTEKRLFVATHSSSFLMGCIQSGVPVNIVRLTYNFNPPTARLLPPDRILKLMRHPLLRSTGVLNGLFFETVVVAESDADRAFYQEINERLISAGDPRAVGNCLFLNAQNKQTVWEIVRPLRELGIPAAAIVDIDVLKDGGGEFTKVLDGALVPEVNHPGLHKHRQAVMRAVERTGRNLKREGGVGILEGEEREGCENLLAQLKQYGIFVVERGELESWLRGIGVDGGHGPVWLQRMFDALGSDPSAPDYVRPAEGDVWGFLDQIRSWARDPNKRGIPT